MGKKKMKKVIPFAVMTTMLLSATLPAFAASGFVFEDWDLGIVSERKEIGLLSRSSKFCTVGLREIALIRTPLSVLEQKPLIA
mgnify:CR=1 FL=1